MHPNRFALWVGVNRHYSNGSPLTQCKEEVYRQAAAERQGSKGSDRTHDATQNPAEHRIGFGCLAFFGALAVTLSAGTGAGTK
jgi:hypothetical protein